MLYICNNPNNYFSTTVFAKGKLLILKNCIALNILTLVVTFFWDNNTIDWITFATYC